MPRNETAAPPTVGDIPAEYLLCRDLGHAWAPYDVRVTRGEIVRVLKCRSCPTLKVQTLTLRGQIDRTKYDYPKGYVMPGLGRMSSDQRATVRLASTDLLMMSSGSS